MSLGSVSGPHSFLQDTDPVFEINLDLDLDPDEYLEEMNAYLDLDPDVYLDEMTADTDLGHCLLTS